MLNINKLKLYLPAVVVGLAAAASTPVYAANEAMLDLLKILRDKGSITTGEYELLRGAAVADEEKNVSAVGDAKSTDMPKVTLKGKFKIESRDGQHSFQPIGRIFWDSIWIDDDGSDSVSGGSELRRARLGFEAEFFKNWKAKLEYDFAGSDANLKDGYIAYGNKFGAGNYSVKVGQHHVPFGFATISSSKYMSFLRRPLFADGPLQPARKYGIALQAHDEDYRWNVHAGWFLGEPEDGEVNVEGEGEDEQTLAVRFTGIPFMTDNKHLLHLGASYMNLDPKGDRLRVRQRALTHLDSERMFEADFGTGVDGVDAFDIEALGIWGPFYALGEYIQWGVDHTAGDADLSAWSFEGGWFLTGESKKYDKAVFGSISPNEAFGQGGWGAWEIALRYENMDLNDGPVTGGDGDVLTAGINWYPIKNIRFMANYSKVVDFSRPGHADDGKEPSALSVRSMVYW